jgi:FKBP-type peptidyl-prolyl cis-trans isomerase
MGLLLLIVIACKETGKEKVTQNGFKFTVIKEGDNKPPKTGEILLFDFQLKDSKDSVWNDSYRNGLPAAIEIRDTSEVKKQDGITQMLHMLTAGDSVKTTMPISEFFKTLVKRPVPPTMDSTLNVTYSIKAKNFMSMDDFIKWRSKTIADHDKKEIKKYLAEHKIDAKEDTSGLFYVVHNQTTGPKPAIDNCVEVKYTGKFLKNGEIFDKNGKIAFPLNQMVQGWKLAIPMLSKGDSGTFFIPSHLAYGPSGYYSIPPDAILAFDVTLLDFKNTYDEATKSCK